MRLCEEYVYNNQAYIKHLLWSVQIVFVFVSIYMAYRDMSIWDFLLSKPFHLLSRYIVTFCQFI
jgi:hypothetical protein